MGIGLGLTGFPYFGSDIAGYMSQGTVPTSEELFYRWVTFGALSPVMRTHHGRSADQNFQWQHDDDSVAHFRRWARLHMQLEPYLSGSLASFDRDGLPLFRLIALDYPDEPWAWSVLDEYELGDRILVAPIQVMGATSRVVELPGGNWYPLLGGAARLRAPITASAAMTEIPAFVPAGTLLVLYPDGVDTLLDAPQAAGATTSANVGNDRDVWLWPGAAARPEIATWHDELGPTGVPQWTWIGRRGQARHRRRRQPATECPSRSPSNVRLCDDHRHRRRHPRARHRRHPRDHARLRHRQRGRPDLRPVTLENLEAGDEQT